MNDKAIEPRAVEGQRRFALDIAESVDLRSRVNKAIVKWIAYLRGVTTRDGSQSVTGNCVEIDALLAIQREIDELARMVVQDYNGYFPPEEMAGGGEFAQPAMMEKKRGGEVVWARREDAFFNLEKMEKIAPHVVKQMLLRGRQVVGFEPVSDEMIEKAVFAFADRRVKVFRIFDFNNDIRNIEAAFAAVKKYNGTYLDNLVIEGAVCYINQSDHWAQAWTIDEYVDYAASLVRKGAKKIVIKDFAGVGYNDDLPGLVRKMKERVGDVDVAVHSHGEKPEVLMACIEAGAKLVDVASGKLSRGPSHTNMRNLLLKLVQKELEDINPDQIEAEFNKHNIVKQIDKIERTIEEQLATQTHLDEPMQEFTPDEIRYYSMAGGARADIWKRILPLGKPKIDSVTGEYVSKKVNDISEPIIEYIGWEGTRQELFEKALSICRMLQKVLGGNYDPVTPGAKISTDQMAMLLPKICSGQPILMTDYNETFMEVITSRYGTNHGMEKTLIDVEECHRDRCMMYQALRTLNRYILDGRIKDLGVMQQLFLVSGITGSAIELGERRGIRCSMKTGIDFKDESVKKILANLSEKKFEIKEDGGVKTISGIEKFSRALRNENIIPKDLQAEMLDNLDYQKSINNSAWIGDVEFRDAILMYRTLVKLCNMNLSRERLEAFLTLAGLEGDKKPLIGTDSKINFKDPELETKLRRADIYKFRQALYIIKERFINNDQYESLKLESTQGRAESPQIGIEEGRRILREIEEKHQINVEEMRKEGKPISDSDTLALMVILLRRRDPKTGKEDYSAFENLVKAINKSQVTLPNIDPSRNGVAKKHTVGSEVTGEKQVILY